MDKDIATASKYLNNLLAARGLLKGGHKIAFDNPTEDDTTPTRIINLVHDLVRRRDRDGEQKETLAMGMKTLKDSENRANASAERYKSRCEELERRCATLQGQERVLNANVRSAEITAKALKDEAARLKVMVQQVRMQCANDIRKRDHQISKMKERLLEKSRGGRGNKQPISFPGITISGTASTTHLGGSVGADPSSAGLDNVLTDDTTAILTTLSQNLADENDTLVSMIKSTLTTLKAISSMDIEVDQEAELEEGDRNVIANDVSFEALSSEVDEVLEHLKDMLNQPNYVPLEDLDVRDREIERLRQQLQGTLEAWKNAIALVDLVNQKPDKCHSKQIKALENVVERERKMVLEEVDPNVQTIPLTQTSHGFANNDEENADIWQEEIEERIDAHPREDFFHTAKLDTENNDFAEELPFGEHTANQDNFHHNSRTNPVYTEEKEEEAVQNMEESAEFVPADDDNIDEEDDESSMELMSPIKPSIFNKKRSFMDTISPSRYPSEQPCFNTISPSPHLAKRTRFIDVSPRRKGEN